MNALIIVYGIVVMPLLIFGVAFLIKECKSQRFLIMPRMA